jgi:hypothetical protein
MKIRARDGKGLALLLAGPERSEALDSPVARLAPCPRKKELITEIAKNEIHSHARV